MLNIPVIALIKTRSGCGLILKENVETRLDTAIIVRSICFLQRWLLFTNIGFATVTWRLCFRLLDAMLAHSCGSFCELFHVFVNLQNIFDTPKEAKSVNSRLT